MPVEHPPRARLRAVPALSADDADRNRLLASLPSTTLARLREHLEPVALARGDVVFRASEPPRHAYFPRDAVVALVLPLRSGEALQVGAVGYDGFVGPPLCAEVTTMPCDGIVQLSGAALRIPIDVLAREVAADRALASAVARFMHLLLGQTMQNAACNGVHGVEARCVRWLLTVHDLTGRDDIPLTHDLVAAMLGVRRATVTLTLRALHRRGIVAEGRGRVVLRNRAALERIGCECYRALRDHRDRLLSGQP